MCVAPLERWPKLVSLMLLCHQRDSEGLCGPLRRFLVSGNGNRCKKCSVLSYVLSLHFQMVRRPRGRCPGCGGFPVVPQVSWERWTLKETLPPIFSKATQVKKNKI